jgi:hypothetical protein
VTAEKVDDSWRKLATPQGPASEIERSRGTSFRRQNERGKPNDDHVFFAASGTSGEQSRAEMSLVSLIRWTLNA